MIFMNTPKTYIIRDGYIGRFIGYDCGFAEYRFPGGVAIGDDFAVGFDDYDEAVRYCKETYGHAN
jgi:hypothetical protein